MFRTIIRRSSVRLNATRTIAIECPKRAPIPNHRNVSFVLSQKLKSEPWLGFGQMRHCSSLPSHTRVTLPALSPTMEEGTLISWEKKEGDKLNEGDLLAEIETDKATMAFETPEEGYLAKILVPAGTKGVPIGKLVCIIVENESDLAAFKDYKDDGKAAKSESAAPVPPPTASSPTPAPPMPAPSVPSPPPPPVTTGRVYASPMAKRLAEKQNIRLQGKGTGLFDSITSSDLERLAASAAPIGAPTPSSTPPPVSMGGSPAAAYTDIPVTNMRSVIAKRLLQSKTTIPHYYLTVEVQVDKVMSLRKKFNEKLEKTGGKVSINDFVIKATAMASKKVPDANSAWHDTFIRKYKNVDISVAVSTETGLITPIVFEANNKGVADIGADMKKLANKAREGKLLPQEFQGGTISVSNLGMFGVDQFAAIINPPQSAILAASSVNSKLVIDDKSEKGFREVKVMNVTLCCDHRVIDGAAGAKWLQAFKEYIEDPEMMIL